VLLHHWRLVSIAELIVIALVHPDLIRNISFRLLLVAVVDVPFGVQAVLLLSTCIWRNIIIAGRILIGIVSDLTGLLQRASVIMLLVANVGKG